MQILYQLDLSAVTLDEAYRSAVDTGESTPEAQQFSRSLASGVWDKKEELDPLISKYSKDWDIRRLGHVEKSVLRLAIFELLNRPETPPAVVLDEAVELAKTYGGEDSPKLVNGILATVLREHVSSSSPR